MCVVVVTITRAACASSRASASSSVVFPPAPMIAVTPFRTSSAFASSMSSPLCFRVYHAARRSVKSLRFLLTMANFPVK